MYWGQLQTNSPTGFIGMFYNCINLNLSLVSDILNLTGVVSLEVMFNNCSSIVNILKSFCFQKYFNAAQQFDIMDEIRQLIEAVINIDPENFVTKNLD